MDVVYAGRPDWEFLPRCIDPLDEDLAWPFLVGQNIASSDRAITAWTLRNEKCQLSLEWLSRNSDTLNRARKTIASLAKQSDTVRYQPPPWLEVEVEDEELVYLDGLSFDCSKVFSLPRLRLVGLSQVPCSDGKATALFMRWGYCGTAVLLPIESEKRNS